MNGCSCRKKTRGAAAALHLPPSSSLLQRSHPSKQGAGLWRASWADGKRIKGAVKIMAKDLVRTRHEIMKSYALKSQLEAVCSHIQALQSTQAMAKAMKSVTEAMPQMNKQTHPVALQKMMKDFEMQNQKMEMNGELMGESIDDALRGDGEEEETEDLVNQVLDEIGIDINSELVKAPMTSTAKPTAGAKVQPLAEAADGAECGIDDELLARLHNLRKM